MHVDTRARLEPTPQPDVVTLLTKMADRSEYDKLLEYIRVNKVPGAQLAEVSTMMKIFMDDDKRIPLITDLITSDDRYEVFQAVVEAGVSTNAQYPYTALDGDSLTVGRHALSFMVNNHGNTFWLERGESPDNYARHIELLLNNGVEPNFLGINGYPPICQAVSSLYSGGLHLKYDGDKLVRGSSEFAFEHHDNPMLIINMLLAAGANPSMPTKQGVTAARLAGEFYGDLQLQGRLLAASEEYHRRR